jgi:hypothetical protein
MANGYVPNQCRTRSTTSSTSRSASSLGSRWSQSECTSPQSTLSDLTHQSGISRSSGVSSRGVCLWEYTPPTQKHPARTLLNTLSASSWLLRILSVPSDTSICFKARELSILCCTRKRSKLPTTTVGDSLNGKTFCRSARGIYELIQHRG